MRGFVSGFRLSFEGSKTKCVMLPCDRSAFSGHVMLGKDTPPHLMRWQEHRWSDASVTRLLSSGSPGDTPTMPSVGGWVHRAYLSSCRGGDVGESLEHMM